MAASTSLANSASITAVELDMLPAWIHGDLYSRNVLVKRGIVNGIIDWGDMTSGDPDTDLACLWSLLIQIWNEALAAKDSPRARAAASHCETSVNIIASAQHCRGRGRPPPQLPR
jgi:aminoglycoside phosphotransferase (APT) family kinase protein